MTPPYLRMTRAAVRSYWWNCSTASRRTDSVATMTKAGFASRHGTAPAIETSQFWPSKGLIDRRSASTPSRQRTLTSTLSGSERGT